MTKKKEVSPWFAQAITASQSCLNFTKGFH